MKSAMACWGLALLAWPGGGAAQVPSSLAESAAQVQIRTELRLERRLLALDLLSYSEARARDQRAQEGVTEVLGRLDQALAGDAVALGTLESLQNDLDAARAAARISEERLAAQLSHIQERLQRIGVMEAESGVPARIGDPVTGRWRVTIFPQKLAATFDLRLNGTVVSGSYQVPGGSAGSFRGTYAGGRLRLERIDASGGFDSVWEAAVGNGRITGNWKSNELATGQPTRGDWTAVKEGEP